MGWAMAAQRAWQARWTEELARAWIGRIVETTPLNALDGLALGWLGREAPALVDELLDVLNAEGAAPGLPQGAADRARALTRLRGPSAATEVPRDLAALHVLIAGALARNADGDDEGLRMRLDRLILLMGELHSALAQALVDDGLERDGRDPVTALPGESAMQAELDSLASARGNGAGAFSLLQLDVDGLDHMRASAGADAADRIMRLVAESAGKVLGPAASLFRREGDELAALLPGSEGPAAAALAGSMRDAIIAALGESAMLAPVSIGVAGWPGHASEPAQLLERAREATFVAKSSGQGISLPPAPRAPVPGPLGLQRS